MSPTDWSSLKVVDLRAELSSRGLPTKGVKAELIQRLNDADVAQAADDTVMADEADEINDVPEQVAVTEVVATEPSPVTDTNTTLKDENRGDAEPNEATPHEYAVEVTDTAEPEVNDQVTKPSPLPSNDMAIESQTRKRRSRSRTPPPSAKRVRQEHENLAENQEDAVDFDIGDIPGASQSMPTNGLENGGLSEERATEKDAAAADTSRDAPEVSGGDTQQITIPASSDELPSTSSQLQDEPVVISGEEAYLKRVAIQESSKALSHPHVQESSLGHSDEDTVMKEAGAASPLEETQPTIQSQPDPREAQQGTPQQSQEEAPGEDDPSSTPSTHPPTPALYIRELMRPLRPEAVEQYIVDLVTPKGSDPDPNLIEDFFLDQIRTHAFVQLTSISAAKRVRAALHNQIWPNERNRKPLWVDFIPSGQVKDWIAREESAGRGAQSKRWEVTYEQNGDEITAVHREVGSESKPFSKPPPTGPAAGTAYPGIEAAPRGPRGRGNGPRMENPNSIMTQAQPHLTYTPLSEDVAQRRIDNMRSFYSRDPPSDLGKDYHRYTFENADSFVDRGVEVFVGIRPPHREKEHQERLRRERLGTAGASSATESRRDDNRFRPSVTDEDRFPRYNDDRRPDRRQDRRQRNRGYRGDRGPRRFQGEDPYRYRPGY